MYIFVGSFVAAAAILIIIGALNGYPILLVGLIPISGLVIAIIGSWREDEKYEKKLKKYDE